MTIARQRPLKQLLDIQTTPKPFVLLQKFILLVGRVFKTPTRDPYLLKAVSRTVGNNNWKIPNQSRPLRIIWQRMTVF
jgi:hypothetical protein